MPDAYAFKNFAEYESVVEKLYSEHGLGYEGGFGPTLRTGRALRLSEKERILLKCLDENIALFSLIAFKCSANAPANDAAARSATYLIALTLSSLNAIYNLAESGLAAAALQLCRPLQETTNALVLCRMSDEFARDFSETTNVVVANKFWHQRIARSKDEKSIESSVKNYPGDPGFLLRGLMKGIDDKLGAMIHPSQFGGYIARYTDLHALLQIERDPHFNSAPALLFALSQCFKIHICLFKESVVDAQPITELIPEIDRKIVDSMRKAQLELYLFTLTRQGRLE